MGDTRRRLLAVALMVVFAGVLAACGGPSAAPSSAPQPATAAKVNWSSAQPPAAAPSLTRKQLWAWGKDCAAAKQGNGLYDSGHICLASYLPQRDRAGLTAACQGLALRSASAPRATIILRDYPSLPKAVTLNCDQGMPKATPLDLSKQLAGARDAPGPPVNFAGVRVTIPDPGLRLTTWQNGCYWYCFPLGKGQQGEEYRTSIVREIGPGHPIDVGVRKPSIEAYVARAYNYNRDQIDPKVMIQDEQTLIRILRELDTTAGFTVITSTAGCCG